MRVLTLPTCRYSVCSFTSQKQYECKNILEYDLNYMYVAANEYDKIITPKKKNGSSTFPFIPMLE